MASEKRPCPTCGGKKEVTARGDDGVIYYTPCSDCKGTGEVEFHAAPV